jgi:hypothetical protein
MRTSWLWVKVSGRMGIQGNTYTQGVVEYTFVLMLLRLRTQNSEEKRKKKEERFKGVVDMSCVLVLENRSSLAT